MSSCLPGESYVQLILDQLEGVEVRGSENFDRLLTAIRMLERLRESVEESRVKEAPQETGEA